MQQAMPEAVRPPLVGGVIPVLDVGPYLAGAEGARERLGAELRYAFEQVGFYYLTGHGIDPALIRASYAAAAAFHAQSMEQKLAVKANEHNVGYVPMAGLAAGRKPSANEAFFLRRERTPDDPLVRTKRLFHGLNQWPQELPGFRETALAYMQALEVLCRRLVRLYATALELPPDTFDAAYRTPHTILRLSRYPALEAASEADVFSLVPHTDSGFMTLLAPNEVPGLSIQLPDGRWIDAPSVEGAFIVNGGDILHRWTNERFLSTPHRVINRAGRERYAIPFFCDPDHDTLIECLPSCHSADRPAKYPPIRFGDYAIWFARKTYQHMADTPALADHLVAPGERATTRW